MLPRHSSLTPPPGADPQPYLAGNSFATETGWLSSFLDIWLFFPRAPLMQLIPALTGVQQLLYAHAGEEVGGKEAVLCDLGGGGRARVKHMSAHVTAPVDFGGERGCLVQER